MDTNKTLSHIDREGRAVMVDVGDKATTKRVAIAAARVVFPTEIYQQLIEAKGNTKKGSIIDTARIAGIMAAKNTSNMIPLCHPLPLDKIAVDITYEHEKNALKIESLAQVHHKTGVEMEALTAASVAALTIYDMCKALSHEILITDIRLLSKSGGKHDYMYDKD